VGCGYVGRCGALGGSGGVRGVGGGGLVGVGWVLGGVGLLGGVFVGGCGVVRGGGGEVFVLSGGSAQGKQGRNVGFRVAVSWVRVFSEWLSGLGRGGWMSCLLSAVGG